MLLELEDLEKYFPVRAGILRKAKTWVHAVDGVSFKVFEGESLGLVGESGCGKSTISRMVLGLAEPTRGTVKIMGKDLQALDKQTRRNMRRQVSGVFQDASASMNPRKKVSQILSQPFEVQREMKKDEISGRVMELLADVGLGPPEQFYDRYPHEFSGGQVQRVAIARAIALHPKLVVLDEAVSALDISVRAQILTLLKNIRRTFGLAYLFITHDLAVIRSITDRVAEMYLGQIVEMSPVAEFFERPLHPYTQALIAATPIPDPEKAMQKQRVMLKGEIPSSTNPPSGCRFATRCRNVMPRCGIEEPKLREVFPEHYVACFLHD